MKPQIIGLLAFSVSNLVCADPAVIPHGFSADTPAKAEEVNANFSSLKSSIDDNDTRINANTGSISNVSATTTANASAITANSAALAANRQSIDQNANAIGANTSDIAQNAANIAANASDVLTNALGISDIQADVASNTAAVAGLGSVFVKANGQPIGLLIAGAGSFRGNSTEPRPFTVLSNTDYLFDVDEYGRLYDGFTLYYESADCSGQGYLAGPGNVTAQIAPYYALQGYVLKSPDPSDAIKAYYLPSNTSTLVPSRSMYSIRNINGCQSDFHNVYGYPALPNDSVITGVSGDSFATPITIGR